MRHISKIQVSVEITLIAATGVTCTGKKLLTKKINKLKNKEDSK